MLKDLLAFVKRERFYTFLFLVVSLLYVYFGLASQKEMRLRGTEEKHSVALEKFREAEKRMYSDIQSAGSFEEFLKNRPVLKIAFQLFSLLAVGAFGCGVVLDFCLLFSPRWRRSLAFTGPYGLQTAPPRTASWEEWKLSMLFKVVVLFMSASLLLSLFLTFVHHVMLPESSDNFFLLLHATIADILCLIFLGIVIHGAGGRWKDLGLRIPRTGMLREMAVGLGGYLAALPFFAAVLIFLVAFAHFFHYEPPPHKLVEVFLEEEERSPALIFYSIFLAAAAGPFFEEIFFRGFCYPIFKKRWGMCWALLLSSAFFALIHESTFAFWPIFVLGMALTYLYEKRGSLIAPVTLHIVHNSIFIAYFFLAKQVVMKEGGG